jgi:hypothetical protein
MGNLDSQGGINGSTNSLNTKPVSKAGSKVKDTASKVEGTTSKVGGTAGNVEGAPTATPSVAGASSTASNVDASKAPNTAARDTSKPGQSAALAGGNHSASGAAAASLDAQDAKGANSAGTSGTASDSLN